MKLSNLKTILGLFVAFLLLSSCSKEEGVFISNNENLLNNEEIKSKELLLENLKTFNEAYAEKINQGMYSENELRGFWSKVADVLVVAGADIVSAGAGAYAVKEIATGVGAATGGTGFAVVTGVAAGIAGAGGSIAAARTLRDGSIVKPYVGKLSIKYPTEYQYLASVGELHNNYVASISNGIEMNSSVEKALLENEEFKKIRTSINKIVQKNIGRDNNIESAIAELEVEGLINKKISLVYSLFFEVYNKSRNFNNIEDIINYYLEIVSKTDFLNKTEKEALISSFSVASESPCLWDYQNR